MAQDKVTTIENLAITTTIKELQRFLRFAKFYRWFIRDLSSIAALLTSLIKKRPKKLHWNDSANQAFEHLKRAFTSVTILKQPDPSRPFIVEVDTVLSQRFGERPKLHPVAFFLLLSSIIKLWYQKQGASCHQAGPGGMASQAGKATSPVWNLYLSQESLIHQHCQITTVTPSTLGLIFCPISLHTLILTRFQEHQNIYLIYLQGYIYILALPKRT